MTSREEIIEAAVDAAWDKRRKGVAGQVVVHPPQELYDMIRAALAVFEEAHTPTDDEREALAQWLHMRFAWPHSPNERTPWLDLPERLKDGWRDLAGDAPAGFRRTVQGEPGHHIVSCARCGQHPVVASDAINSDIVLCDRCAFQEGRESVQEDES